MLSHKFFKIPPLIIPGLMILSLLLAGWSSVRLVADLWVNPARGLINKLNNDPQTGKKNPIPAEEQWSEVMASLLAASYLVPDNADYSMWVGWINHRHADLLPPLSPEAKVLFKEADRAYSNALKLRPSWGLIWINRAQVRARQGHSSSAILDLQRAINFDPRNPNVIKQALRLGFVLWHSMGPQDRRGFLLLVKSNFHLMPHSTIDLAKRQGLLEQIRPFYWSDPSARQLWENRLGGKR